MTAEDLRSVLAASDNGSFYQRTKAENEDRIVERGLGMSPPEPKRRDVALRQPLRVAQRFTPGSELPDGIALLSRTCLTKPQRC